MSDKGKDIGMAVLAVVAVGALERIYYVGENIISQLKHAAYDFTGDVIDMFSFSSPINTGHLLGAGMMYGAYKGFQQFHVPEMKAIRVTPNEDGKIDPVKVQKMTEGLIFSYEGMLNRFLKGRVWIRWLITRDEEGMIRIWCLAPAELAKDVKNKIDLGYPKFTVQVDNEFQGVPFYDPTTGYVGHMKWAARSRQYGLKDTLENNIGDIFYTMPNCSIIDLRISRGDHDRLETKSWTDWGRYFHKYAGDEDGKRKEGRICLDISINLWSKYYSITGMAKEIQQHMKGPNTLKIHEYKILKAKRNALNHDFVVPLPNRRLQVNDLELAPFFFFPDPEHRVFEFVEIVPEKIKPKKDELQVGQVFGVVNHPEMKDRKVRIQDSSIVNHMLIAGTSGGGKGSVLTTWFGVDGGFLDQWIEDGMGATYFDPHYYGCLNIINHLQEKERQGKKIPWEKVVCISFGTIGAEKYPVAMNILNRGNDKIDDVVTYVTESILNAFPGDLSESATQLGNAVHALLWSKEPHAISDIPRMFMSSESAFRNQVLSQVGNKFIQREWQKIRNKYFDIDNPKDVAVKAIDTRLNPFLSKQSMQRFFCRRENQLDVSKWLNQGYLVLIDFLGSQPEARKLIANWLTHQYYAKSQERGKGGRKHILIFDEVNLFNIPVFKSILRENRKFNMGLCLMTQEFEKLDSDLQSALNNAAVKISLRQSLGAKEMSKLLNEKFSIPHLRSLKKGHEAALWSVDGACSLKVNPPAYLLDGVPTALDSEEEKKAIKIAEEKFMELLARDCKPVHEVDKEVESVLDGIEFSEEEDKKPQIKKKASRSLQVLPGKQATH